MAVTHLIHHTSGYIFRYCIPQDIQPLIKKRELRYSLKTGSLRCAKARASNLISFIRSVVDDLRGCPPTRLTADQINYQFRTKLKEITGQVHRSERLGASTIVPSVSVPSGPRLSEVLKRHAADAKKARQWSPKTTQEVISCIELFIQVVGNRQIDTIDKKAVREYKETLMRLPSNLRKRPEYRDKSILEILAMPPIEASRRLSAVTINKLLRRLSTFYRYAMNHGYVQSNPAEGMQLAINKRQDQFRDAFDDTDLRALFGSKEYRQDGFKRSYQFWAPIIGRVKGRISVYNFIVIQQFVFFRFNGLFTLAHS